MGRPKGSLNKNRKPDIALECQTCGELFGVRPWRIEQGERKGKPVRFCSAACQRSGTADSRKKFGAEHPHWKNGASSYRDRAFREFGARCQDCGYDRYQQLVQVHHKNFKGRASQDDHSIENLVVLCIRCHLERHISFEGGLSDAIQEQETSSLDAYT